MRTIGWMHTRFWQNRDEQSRSVSTKKSYSCFSSLWELDEQQRYEESKNNSAHLRQSAVVPVNEEKITEMTPEFLDGLLAIGTFGSVSITKEAITPKTAIPFETVTEKENRTEENEVQQSLKEYSEIPATKEEEYSEIPATKEETTELEITPYNLIKKNVKAYNKKGKLEKGLKRETHALHFMKKMLKKLDFSSRRSPTSAGSTAIFCDSTDNKPTTKATKIHPEETYLRATKFHNYEANRMIRYYEGYGNDLAIEDDGIMYPRDGTFSKETVSKQIGKKEHWIKTDADYIVLEL